MYTYAHTHTHTYSVSGAYELPKGWLQAAHMLLSVHVYSSPVLLIYIHVYVISVLLYNVYLPTHTVPSLSWVASQDHREVGDGDHGTSSWDPCRHDPSKEASLEAPTRQHSDCPHGRQHVLHLPHPSSLLHWSVHLRTHCILPRGTYTCICTSWKNTVCSEMDRSMEKRRGVREVQNVLPSMRAIWVLTGWCFKRCFFGGIMSARISRWGSMISVTDFSVILASNSRQWWDCVCG